MTEKLYHAKTIYALSSGALPSGVAIIRVSGGMVSSIVQKICGRGLKPRYAHYLSLKDPFNGDLLDDGLVLFFPAPHSFTGEDVCEFHLHGGSAVVKRFMRMLGSFEGVVAAERGEFTRRALYNNKMDLTAVEGLSDLIKADTEMQRRQALHLMRGGALKLIEGWRNEIIKIRALIEAELDFSDEEDVDSFDQNLLRKRILALGKIFHTHLSRHQSERLREGLHIVFVGAPNVGKSSLLNMLAQRDIAIVTDFEGTTRDSLDLHLDLEGYPFLITDTAGLREASDRVEKIGIEKTFEQCENADLLFYLDDGKKDQSHFLKQFYERFRDQKPFYHIRTKSDLLDSEEKQSLKNIDCFVSTLQEKSLSQFFDFLKMLAGHYMGQKEIGLVTQERHRLALNKAHQAIENALDVLDNPVLLAEDLRQAHHALGQFIGKVDVEEVLDFVFSEFCIGK